MYSFEGKLHAFRRTQDGVVVSYLVHPSDVSAELATASLGTRYMVALAEIGDDEKPIELAQETQVALEVTDANGKRQGLDSVPAKERRPFASLPLSQQAAMRTEDKSFQDFLEASEPIHGQASYADVIRTLCGVESRSDIRLGTPAGLEWQKLEDNYQSWLTDARYSGSKR